MSAALARLNTTSSRWLRSSPRELTMPMPGRLRDRRTSVISDRARSSSPGRTGACRRSSSKPSALTAAVFSSVGTLEWRAQEIAKTWAEQATRPPNTESAATTGSVWKGWGSHRSAISMISSCVTR